MRVLDQVSEGHLGDAPFALIAGPCTVESRDQTLITAASVAAAGATMLRGGAYKPRTSPHAFRGLGRAGLRILEEAKAETGLPVVTEVTDVRELAPVLEVADVIQVGARNMSNFALLTELGRAGAPVLLKRGLASTLDELLLAAEYVLTEGNEDVMLCERGIRTFETAYRFTLDLAAVPVLKARTSLPVIVDPSHAAGRRELVRAAQPRRRRRRRRRADRRGPPRSRRRDLRWPAVADHGGVPGLRRRRPRAARRRPRRPRRCVGRCSSRTRPSGAMPTSSRRGSWPGLESIPFHDEGPLVRRLLAGGDIHPGAQTHVAVHRVDGVRDADRDYCDVHVHTVAELNLFLPITELVYDVVLGEETYEVEGPASVFIPAGLPHSANVRSGTGFFVAIVLGVQDYGAAFASAP